MERVWWSQPNSERCSSTWTESQHRIYIWLTVFTQTPQDWDAKIITGHDWGLLTNMWGSLNSFCFHCLWLRLILWVHNFQGHRKFQPLIPKSIEEWQSGILWVQISAAALNSSVLWKPLSNKSFIHPNFLNYVLLEKNSFPHTFNISYLLLSCFWRGKRLC